MKRTQWIEQIKYRNPGFGSILLAVFGTNAGTRAARAQANGSTTDIPGSLPGIHLVSPVAAGQWTMPAGDYANTRFSPLDKINTQNVQNLHIVATMSTGIPHGHEGQPLVVNNTLYMVTPFPNNLIASTSPNLVFRRSGFFIPILIIGRSVLPAVT